MLTRALMLTVGGMLAALLPAQASYFRLEVHPGSRILAGRVAVRATLTNRGDEVMRTLQTSVWFNGTWYKGPLYPELGVGGSQKDDIDAGPLPHQHGTYTAVISARYTDRNGHPFTTIETIPVHSDEPVEHHPFEASLAPITMRDSGTLVFTATSVTNVALTATIHLVLPEEVQGLPTPDCTLEIPPGGTVEQSFPLRNAWAVAGSQYRIFAIVDYSRNGIHGSRVVPGGVTLRAPRLLTATDIRWLWILPAALLGLFGLSQLRRRGDMADPPSATRG
ncbi:MAG: hypothetical protein K8T26_01955 [Lentisphaerae bacterium]|nr:hypothetical protein [Lentisphaerota bacterium]